MSGVLLIRRLQYSISVVRSAARHLLNSSQLTALGLERGNMSEMYADRSIGHTKQSDLPTLAARPTCDVRSCTTRAA